MNRPVNLLVDYKDARGRYYHQSFVASPAPDEETAAACVMEKLRREGYTVTAMAVIYGTHTLPDLDRLADQPPRPGMGRLLYLSPDEYAAGSAENTAEYSGGGLNDISRRVNNLRKLKFCGDSAKASPSGCTSKRA